MCMPGEVLNGLWNNQLDVVSVPAHRLDPRIVFFFPLKFLQDSEWSFLQSSIILSIMLCYSLHKTGLHHKQKELGQKQSPSNSSPERGSTSCINTRKATFQQ